ncbi:hypothetical protein BJ138DRAFT_1082431 [Hygrophoropsis aurantiaca]|uniref:Uncharacterized protein n=1 Tax=Hygrophoropsis aurantiaca TaxID=72124 RepID=A0ACB8AIL7_9AGAM|nr:hypothetical protein BJ138DRAFT_1082431 [Hygrophoropsis aurantiaca]
MKFSSGLPQSLPKECTKAAKIFTSFVDSKNNGLDGVIPRSVLENAKGFAIFTILKAGFLFSARAGTGIVIVKLPDGTWSAPSAIGSAGLGVGGQLGAEVTDFLIILNSVSAVKTFMSSGSLTLGGNMSVAVGPLGRSGEAVGSLNTSGKVATMYSYSKTRGLFGGISIEGSVIVERQDANAQAYNSDVTAKMLLSGGVDPPEWASPLIKTIEACTGMPGNRKWVDDSGRTSQSTPYHFSGLASPTGERSMSSMFAKKKKVTDFPPESWGRRRNSGSYFDSGDQIDSRSSEERPPMGSAFGAQFESDDSYDSSPPRNTRHRPFASVSTPQASVTSSDTYDPNSPFNSLPPFRMAHSGLSEKTISHSRSLSVPTNSLPSKGKSVYSNPFSSSGPPSEDELEDDLPQQSTSKPTPVFISPKPQLTTPLSPNEGVARAIALYDFKAVESGDLSFSKGDIIIITRKSESTDDWWKGKTNDREGIFPANFVEVV